MSQPSPILSKWERLDRLNPGSREYHILLTHLLNDDTDRRATTSLEGEEAAIVLDILANSLNRSRNPGNLSSHILRVLRKLAYNTSQVPNSYKIDRKLRNFEIQPGAPFASGGFSNVRKGTLDGNPVAVKVLRVSRETNVVELQKNFCKETALWKNISHPNILSLIAVEADDAGMCLMVSELMVNGNIFNFVQHNSVNRLRLLTDVAEGLHYLHSRNIFHGDVKGSNILITNATPPRACLSDFGFSAPAPTKSFLVSTRGVNPGWGTPLYMAPELILPSNYGLPFPQVSKEADMYAMGMVVYEVVTGVRPFGVEGFQPWESMFQVVGGNRPAKPDDVETAGFGRAIWDLVEKCWSQNPTERPRAWDARLRLSIAASMSSDVPQGRRIAVPLTRDISTSSSVGPNMPNIGNNRGNPGRARGDLVQQYSNSILRHPMFEGSIMVASRVVGGIQATVSPTVQQGFKILEGFKIRKLFTNVKTNLRLKFGSPRNQRLHQE